MHKFVFYEVLILKHVYSVGLEYTPSQAKLPMFLEFAQHHLLLGADHIFMGARFLWNSPHMSLILQAFRSFILEGTVSMTSLTGDNLDKVYSVKGMEWYRDNIKILHITQQLYLAKGVAEYVGRHLGFGRVFHSTCSIQQYIRCFKSCNISRPSHSMAKQFKFHFYISKLAWRAWMG